eukprot:CAMPEP_0184421194 /NCGR_PEP_ID=MMETSP0738-20130409/60749_1 /TAXON_ID=385413 /ORGANISM="Thalassiosira miniscula, Strain CCMP1093" /LENGTH=84 /DNA_ID=CAMNT_0026782435 /DNA_START=86 /DNA_END=340 /DNA_ORIENTATION=+
MAGAAAPCMAAAANAAALILRFIIYLPQLWHNGHGYRRRLRQTDCNRPKHARRQTWLAIASNNNLIRSGGLGNLTKCCGGVAVF